MSSSNGSCGGATATRSTSIDSVCAAETGNDAGIVETFLPQNGDENGHNGAMRDGNRATILTKKERIKRFFTKYFLQGQQYSEEVALDEDAGETARWMEAFLERNRKYIGFFLPCLLMQTLWWTLAVRYDFFRLYPTHYELPITMILGATVAGMTSEGGGAVAFPVMTLLLRIDPIVARDFSLMIQSCGMTSAAFTILWMRIKLEWHSIVLCTLGSTAGIIFGLEWVDHLLNGPEKKMLFVSIWFSFAISLFVLNMQRKRRTYSSIVHFNWWKALVLYVTGFIGGLCSAFSGSGVDICSFSMLTLLFRVSEKVATPTSVVLMAANTCIGFFWRHLIMSDISQLAWNYFACSVPVVVICAPMGSFLASHFHRLVLATFVYVLEVVAVLGFLATRPQPYLVLIGSIIVLISFLFFLAISRLGQRLHEQWDGGKGALLAKGNFGRVRGIMLQQKGEGGNCLGVSITLDK